MFGIGMPELILILALALIFIGPSKLPDLAKSIGRAMGEFRKATNEIKSSIEIESEMSDVKKTFSRMYDPDEEEKSEPDASEATSIITKGDVKGDDIPGIIDVPGEASNDSIAVDGEDTRSDLTWEDIEAGVDHLEQIDKNKDSKQKTPSETNVQQGNSGSESDLKE